MNANGKKGSPGPQDKAPLTEDRAREIIDCEAASTMIDLAVRIVFGEALPAGTRAILERIPTLRAVYDFAPTEKLVEVVSADMGVEPRQGHRYLKAAIETEWVIQLPHLTKGRLIDNLYNPSREIPKKMTLFTDHVITIGKVVEAQRRDPLNITAGSGLIDAR